MHKNFISKLSCFFTLCILCVSLPAYSAGISHSTLPVTANIVNLCLTVTATTMAFGNYTGAQLNATNIITVTCLTLSSTYTVQLNPGLTAGSTFAQRLMANGAATLKYNIYTNNTYSTVWGNGSSGTGVITSPNLSLIQNYTAYGRIPANQTQAPAGNYQDTITVSVVY